MDGGLEFAAGFEAACQERAGTLWVASLCSRPVPPSLILPRKDVERTHRTHTEEFYEVEDFPLDMAGLNQALRAWERTYNTIPPRGYPTRPLITSPLKSILDGATQSWPFLKEGPTVS